MSDDSVFIEPNYKMRFRIDDALRCKFCGSVKVVKNGSFHGVQRWLCRACGRLFVDNQAIPKMHTPTSEVSLAIESYFTGTSLNRIRDKLDQQYNDKPSDSSIYSWVTRFSKIAIDKANKYTPKVGDTWIADETVIGVAGEKGYKIWVWDIIDSETRFLLATHMSLTRTTKDAQILMRKAYEKAEKAPKTIITDRLAAYLDGIELVFGADTQHLPSQPFVDKDFSTNLIERFQGTLKDRTKVMRGFKKLSSARLILDGWITHYNFFRTHESLGDKTPAEVTGINFPFKNWREVVESQAYPTSKQISISSDISNVSKTQKRVAHRKQRKVKRYSLYSGMPAISSSRRI